MGILPNYSKSIFSLLAIGCLTASPLCGAESTYVNDTQKMGPQTEAGPENAEWETEARLELAKVLNNLHHWGEAEKEFREVLAVKPKSMEAQLGLAQSLFFQGKLEAAITELEEAQKNHLTDKELLTVADTYSSLKLYDRAEQIYRNYLKKFPDNDEVRFKLADMLSWEKRYNESISEYRKILARRPNDIQVRRKYAFVLMYMGNDDEAASELMKTLKQ